MRLCVVGAGAMGSIYGGRLALAGVDVTLIDTWADHVAAINRDGLRLDEPAGGTLTIKIKAATGIEGLTPFDAAIVFVDANSTRAGAETARAALAPDGFALTLQNGIGNVETLVDVLGAKRVLGGLSYHSAAPVGPGHMAHTHIGPTWLGELDAKRTPRLETLAAAMEKASLRPTIVDDVMGYIWTKFILNSAINPICAVTGLRVGELGSTPSADDFQTRIIEEILAVVAAKGITLVDPDPMATIKAHCRSKFNKPSMLQHIEAGKRTEIDALNGAVVREAKALGIAVPFNEALTLLVKSVEKQRQQAVKGPPIDYVALEASLKR